MAGEREPIDPQYMLGVESPQRTRQRVVKRVTEISRTVADKLPRLGLRSSPERERQQFATIFDRLSEKGLQASEIHDIFDHNLPQSTSK